MKSMRTPEIIFLLPSQVEPDEFIIDGGEIVPFNTRTDFGDLSGLAKSIRTLAEQHGSKAGVQQPIRVRKAKDGTYKLTNGERRWRACSKLEKDGFEIFIPAIVEPAGYDIKRRLMDLLVTNDGKPLTMLEQAKAMGRLRDSGVDPKEIAAQAGVSITHVKTCFSLLNLCPELVKAVEDNEMTATLAVDLSRELDLNGEDIGDVLSIARRARDDSESDHITAKHLPFLVGKPAVEARKAAKAAKTASKARAAENSAHAIYEQEQDCNTGSEELPGPGDSTNDTDSVTIPFQDVEDQPDTATTNDHGFFISGVEVIPVPIEAKGVRKAEIRIASRTEGEWFFGYQVAWPSADRRGGWINLAPNTNNQAFPDRPAAVLAALQELRATLNEADFPSKAKALDEIDARIALELKAEGEARQPATTVPAPAKGAGHRTEDKLDPASVLKSLKRENCNLDRYDTLTFLVKFLQGRKTVPELANFIMGVTEE